MTLQQYALCYLIAAITTGYRFLGYQGQRPWDFHQWQGAFVCAVCWPIALGLLLAQVPYIILRDRFKVFP